MRQCGQKQTKKVTHVVRAGQSPLWPDKQMEASGTCFPRHSSEPESRTRSLRLVSGNVFWASCSQAGGHCICFRGRVSQTACTSPPPCWAGLLLSELGGMVSYNTRRSPPEHDIPVVLVVKGHCQCRRYKDTACSLRREGSLEETQPIIMPLENPKDGGMVELVTRSESC